MDATPLWYLIAAALVLAGLAGVILPALPGLPLVFGGMLLAAWADGFRHVGAWTLTLLGLLTLLSLAVDFLATVMGAKRVGASRLALLGAAAGTLAGLMFGIIGVFVGPFVGALLGELAHRRRLHGGDIGHAAKVGLGTWVGIVAGTVLKLGIAFAMLGVFAAAWMLAG